jgi:hypothetical protein
LSSTNNGGKSMSLQNEKAPFLESGGGFNESLLDKSDAFHVLDLARLIENIVGGVAARRALLSERRVG